MRYGEEHGVPGSVPEFGAIFMANRKTMKECLKRNLFGLPSGMANFAEQVKTGMILFLFEYERRELFGVFKAISDGAINIIPDAYKSSGMSFPAQVRIASVWSCSPLSEREFHDAINENYFSAKKFNFGLSENQVHRLLCLFSSRKIDKEVPRRQFGRENNIPFVEEREQIEGDRRNDVVEYESNLRNHPAHRYSTKLPEDSLEIVKRLDYERYSMSDSAKREDKVDYELERENFWVKRRMNDQNVREIEHFEHQILQTEMDNTSIPLDSSFDKVRRIGVDRRILEANDGGYISDNLENKIKYDNSFGRYRNNEDIEHFYSTKITETEYSSPLTSLKKMQMSDFDRPYSVSRTVSYDPHAPDVHLEPLPHSPSYIDLNYRSPPKIESTPHHHSEFPSLNSCLNLHLPEILPQIQKINRVSTPVLVDTSFAFEDRYQDSKRRDLGPANDEALIRKDTYSPDSGTLRYDDNKNRTSVFSRLSMAPKPPIRERENRTQMVRDSYGMDSSVDDIMNMLRQSQNHQITARKYKQPMVRRQDNDEDVRAKDFFDIHDTVSYEKSRSKIENDNPDVMMKFDVDEIIKNSSESILKETRPVDFKRRSAVKRNLDENAPPDSVDIKESKGQLSEKPRKRRKLVRPRFEKDSIKESFSEQSTEKVTSAPENDTSPNVDLVQTDGNSDEQSTEKVTSASENDTSPNVDLVQTDGNSDEYNEKETPDNTLLGKLSNLLSKVKSGNDVSANSGDTVIN